MFYCVQTRATEKTLAPINFAHVLECTDNSAASGSQITGGGVGSGSMLPDMLTHTPDAPTKVEQSWKPKAKLSEEKFQ